MATVLVRRMTVAGQPWVSLRFASGDGRCVVVIEMPMTADLHGLRELC